MHPKEQCRLAIEGSTRPDVLTRRRARMAIDPLAHRARSAALWRSDTCWPRVATPTWVFYRQPGFRRYLMPDVRTYLDARQAARRVQHAAEMAESERRWRHAKALKNARPLPLFGGGSMTDQINAAQAAMQEGLTALAGPAAI